MELSDSHENEFVEPIQSPKDSLHHETIEAEETGQGEKEKFHDIPSYQNPCCGFIKVRLSLLEDELQSQCKDLELIQKEITEIKAISQDFPPSCIDLINVSVPNEKEKFKKLDSEHLENKQYKNSVCDSLGQAHKELIKRNLFAQQLGREITRLKKYTNEFKSKLSDSVINIEQKQQTLQSAGCEICKFCMEHGDLQKYSHTFDKFSNHEGKNRYIIENLCEENEVIKRCLSKIYKKLRTFCFSSNERIDNIQDQHYLLSADNVSFYVEAVYNSFENFCEFYCKLQEELFKLRHSLMAAEKNNHEYSYYTSHTESVSSSGKNIKIKFGKLQEKNFGTDKKVHKSAKQNFVSYSGKQDYLDYSPHTDSKYKMLRNENKLQNELLHAQKQLEMLHNKIFEAVQSVRDVEVEENSSESLVEMVISVAEECSALRQEVSYLRKLRQEQRKSWSRLRRFIMDSEKKLEREGRSAPVMKEIIKHLGDMIASSDSSTVDEIILYLYSNQLEWLEKLLNGYESAEEIIPVYHDCSHEASGVSHELQEADQSSNLHCKSVDTQTTCQYPHFLNHECDLVVESKMMDISTQVDDEYLSVLHVESETRNAFDSSSRTELSHEIYVVPEMQEESEITENFETCQTEGDNPNVINSSLKYVCHESDNKSSNLELMTTRQNSQSHLSSYPIDLLISANIENNEFQINDSINSNTQCLFDNCDNDKTSSTDIISLGNFSGNFANDLESSSIDNNTTNATLIDYNCTPSFALADTKISDLNLDINKSDGYDQISMPHLIPVFDNPFLPAVDMNSLQFSFTDSQNNDSNNKTLELMPVNEIQHCDLITSVDNLLHINLLDMFNHDNMNKASYWNLFLLGALNAEALVLASEIDTSFKRSLTFSVDSSSHGECNITLNSSKSTELPIFNSYSLSYILYNIFKGKEVEFDSNASFPFTAFSSLLTSNENSFFPNAVFSTIFASPGEQKFLTYLPKELPKIQLANYEKQPITAQKASTDTILCYPSLCSDLSDSNLADTVAHNISDGSNHKHTNFNHSNSPDECIFFFSILPKLFKSFNHNVLNFTVFEKVNDDNKITPDSESCETFIKRFYVNVVEMRHSSEGGALAFANEFHPKESKDFSAAGDNKCDEKTPDIDASTTCSEENANRDSTDILKSDKNTKSYLFSIKTPEYFDSRDVCNCCLHSLIHSCDEENVSSLNYTYDMNVYDVPNENNVDITQLTETKAVKYRIQIHHSVSEIGNFPKTETSVGQCPTNEFAGNFIETHGPLNIFLPLDVSDGANEQESNQNILYEYNVGDIAEIMDTSEVSNACQVSMIHTDDVGFSNLQCSEDPNEMSDNFSETQVLLTSPVKNESTEVLDYCTITPNLALSFAAVNDVSSEYNENTFNEISESHQSALEVSSFENATTQTDEEGFALLQHRILELEMLLAEKEDLEKKHLHTLCDMAERIEIYKQTENAFIQKLEIMEKNKITEIEMAHQENSLKENRLRDEIIALKDNLDQQNAVLQRLINDSEEISKQLSIKDESLSLQENKVISLQKKLEEMESSNASNPSVNDCFAQTDVLEELFHYHELKNEVSYLRQEKNEMLLKLAQQMETIQHVRCQLHSTITHLRSLKAAATQQLQKQKKQLLKTIQIQQQLLDAEALLSKQAKEIEKKNELLDSYNSKLHEAQEKVNELENELQQKLDIINKHENKDQEHMKQNFSCQTEIENLNKRKEAENSVMEELCKSHTLTLEKQCGLLLELQSKLQKLETLYLSAKNEKVSAANIENYDNSKRELVGSKLLGYTEETETRKLLSISEQTYLNLVNKLSDILRLPDLKRTKALPCASWLESEELINSRKNDLMKILQSVEKLKYDANSDHAFSQERKRQVIEAAYHSERKSSNPMCHSDDSHFQYLSEIIHRAQESLNREYLLKLPSQQRTVAAVGSGKSESRSSSRERRIPLELKNGKILAMLDDKVNHKELLPSKNDYNKMESKAVNGAKKSKTHL